jgi:hypothetical protein
MARARRSIIRLARDRTLLLTLTVVILAYIDTRHDT